MKKTSVLLLGIAAALLIAGAAHLVACSSSSPQSTEEAADEGIFVLREMADADDFAIFGYSSESDIGSEELGEPFEIRTLDADALLENATPTDAMIIADDEFLFPVLVRGEPVQGIRVVLEEDGDWEFVSVESTAEIAAALAAIAANGLDLEQCYLLDLEEVELSFLGYESSGVQMLISLFETNSPSIVKGTAYAFTAIAEEIKAEIVASRDSYDDMVPPAPAAMNPQVSPIVTSPSAKAFGKTKALLNITPFSQEQNQWCWAATGQMTMLFAGGAAVTPTQCSQANQALTQVSCCSYGGTSSCNRPHFPMYDQWGFSAIEVHNPGGAFPTWDALKTLIDAGRPLAFLWRWAMGGGHYMVAYGYYENAATFPATRMVYVMNPWPPGVGERQYMTYENWAGGPLYDHLQTLYFYNIVKN